jgi:rhodanese-related sulfurtransferase
MKHSEGFLRLVQEARGRVREATVAQVRERQAQGRRFEFVLYCGGGYRSALSADSLQKMGYRNVWSMAGGFRAWKEAGLPVEKG